MADIGIERREATPQFISNFEVCESDRPKDFSFLLLLEHANNNKDLEKKKGRGDPACCRKGLSRKELFNQRSSRRWSRQFAD